MNRQGQLRFCREQKRILRLPLYLFWEAVVKPKLKPGDTVRVVGSRGTAKIRAILTSMHGALLRTRSKASGAGIWTSYDW
jgi:hypothetical protein